MDELPRRFNPPKGVRDVMDDEKEIELYQKWGVEELEGKVIHKGFAADTKYVRQHGVWRTTAISYVTVHVVMRTELLLLYTYTRQ